MAIAPVALLFSYMAAGRYNLQILQGKLFDQTFTWSINGSPVNLTSYTAKFKLYDTSGNILLSLSTTLDGSGNGVVLGGSASTVELILKTALTKTLSFTKAQYELELTRPDGEDIPYLVGNAYLTTELASL